MGTVLDKGTRKNMEAKNHTVHYIVQPSVEENNYAVGDINYMLLHFIDSC